MFASEANLADITEYLSKMSSPITRAICIPSLVYCIPCALELMVMVHLSLSSDLRSMCGVLQIIMYIHDVNLFYANDLLNNSRGGLGTEMLPCLIHYRLVGLNSSMKPSKCRILPICTQI